MLHHVSVGVSDVANAAEFYDAVLGALGYKRTAQYLPYAIGYGEGTSEFWIQLPGDQGSPSPGNGAHIGFAARTREAVHRFHETALENGGTDNGPPGPRPDYGPDYYGAFVRDPFGNKLEATLNPASGKRARPARAAKLRRNAAKKRAPGKTRIKAKRAGAKATKKARRKAKRR
ncbi:MAG TPA: VOC family protein [Rhizomicrobium sp.]|jgi:catechol 2,3-dioxygenase-like lactoylglutathione lyase family enzyme|nr:VOC family protein [Rhizomicrobium sp.]